MSTGEWPHDPDGDEGSEGGRKYGMAIFAKKLESYEFPVSIADISNDVGADPIRLNHERVVAAQEILELVEIEAADTREEFFQAIGEAMRSGGFWEYTIAGEKSA
jgi:hypothetical protein